MKMPRSKSKRVGMSREDLHRCIEALKLYKSYIKDQLYNPKPPNIIETGKEIDKLVDLRQRLQYHLDTLDE